MKISHREGGKALGGDRSVCWRVAQQTWDVVRPENREMGKRWLDQIQEFQNVEGKGQYCLFGIALCSL